MNVEKRLLTVKEVCYCLNISRRFLMARYPEWAIKYGVKPLRMGRVLRFDKIDILRLVEKLKVCA